MQANVCTIRVVVYGTQIVVSFEKVSGHNKLSLKIYTFLYYYCLVFQYAGKLESALRLS